MEKTVQQEFSPYLDEREQQMNADYDWALTDPEVRKKYGGQIVIAYQRKVWGAGHDRRAAWEDAQRHPDCPSRGYAAVVVVPHWIPEEKLSDITGG